MAETPQVKARSTYYTPGRVAAARENVRRYDWAAARRDRAVEEAEGYLDDYGDLDGLWSAVTGQTVPRSISVSWKHEVGSPVTGEEIYDEAGHYPWEGEPAERPWTVRDPVSGHVFPTNDFGAYRESGLNERGLFDPDLADDSLLVNERYPERGETWGVDDGTGWVDDDGTRFTFVAYYNHWFVWKRLQDALASLRDAYLLDGDPRFARAGTVLLDRIADVYPELDISVWTDEDRIWNSHGTTGQGKAIGCIWETGLVETMAEAYDAFFPEQTDDDLVAFLDAKTQQYDLGDKSSAGAVRANVENGILREVLPAVRRGQVYGNFGHHQSALATAAVVLDEPEGYTREALDFVFRAGERRHEDDGTYWGSYEVTGGNVRAHLVDVIDRDGHPNESPGYNTIMLSGVRSVAEVLEGYEGYGGTDLFDHPTVERMHAARVSLVLGERYVAHVGDTMQTGDPGLVLDAESLVDAFDRYGRAECAQAAALAAAEDEGTDAEAALRGDAFDDDPESLAAAIEDVLDAEGPLDLPSTNLAGYGFGALRQGGVGSERRDVWVTYGRTGAEAGGSSHNHLDALNLGVVAHGLALAPDLGYPELADYWPKRIYWTTSTVSHNTVLVDDEPQRAQWVGEPRHFGAGEEVDLIDVAAPDAYPETDAYRRTTVLRRIDDDRSYAVDFFRVEGGDDHVFSFHAGAGEAAVEGIDPEPQDGGTYAGPAVPMPDHGEDTAYNDEVGNGYNYLDAVARDGDPADRVAVDWDVVDAWDAREDDADVHLRLTVLGDLDEVALADGHPPGKPGNPERLRYVLARRSGDGGDLRSVFTSVVEPYVGERAIESIDRVPIEAVEGSAHPSARAVRVALDGGRTDYVAYAPGDATHLVDGAFRFRGSLAAYSERDGAPEYAHLTGGTFLEPADGDPLVSRETGRVEGTVADFTRGLAPDNRITVDVTRGDAGAVEVGDWVYVETDHERNGAYEIRGVDGESGRLVLDVGDRTTVKAYRDPDDPEAGYEHVLSSGAAATIPLIEEWHRD